MSYMKMVMMIISRIIPSYNYPHMYDLTMIMQKYKEVVNISLLATTSAWQLCVPLASSAAKSRESSLADVQLYAVRTRRLVGPTVQF